MQTDWPFLLTTVSVFIFKKIAYPAMPRTTNLLSEIGDVGHHSRSLAGKTAIVVAT